MPPSFSTFHSTLLSSKYLSLSGLHYWLTFTFSNLPSPYWSTRSLREGSVDFCQQVCPWYNASICKMNVWLPFSWGDDLRTHHSHVHE
jgi:hypothetical protein